jgi:nucleotidyltransferase/DNA polymerase involved in DNA repair
MAARIDVLDTVTELGPAQRGCVGVCGSHAGLVAIAYAVKAGLRAVVLNDAGVGKDEAGVAGLRVLETIGMAACAVAHTSARIGDGRDAWLHGVVSVANAPARAAGVALGMTAQEAAAFLAEAPAPQGTLPAFSEGRALVLVHPGRPEVWAVDSVGMVVPEDAGRILAIGSHGALHGGRPETALAADALVAVFNDAGVGKDGIGITRLPVLDACGVAAGTVSAASARIGEGRSTYEDGVLSHVNARARALGARPGMTCREWFERLLGN